jgi:hypothetical protein
MKAARWAGFTVLAVASLVACDQLFDIKNREALLSDAGPDSSVEASAEASGEGSVESGGPDTSSDAPLCAGPVVYVSVTTGSDANPGCSNAAPKKSIGAALAAAQAAGTVTSIEVCKGVYNESGLVLTTATSLLGGYGCVDWKRSSGYGYPTFDGTAATVIQNSNPTINSATLNVATSAVTSAALVDGFTILGATSGTITNSAAAVVCSNNASPTLSNNQLSGGSVTAPTGNASAGVLVLTGANPVITGNKINGGSGTIPTTSTEAGHASVGIYADGSSAGLQIVGNAINGGSGNALNTTSGGSVAVSLLGTSGSGTGPSYTVRSNALVAGTGTSMEDVPTTGLFLNGMMTVVVDSNSIDGGGGTTGTACSVGVSVNGTGPSTFTANRIYAGNCGLTSTTTAPQGLKLIGPLGPTVVYNNMIHGGTAAGAPSVFWAAILLGDVTGADIRHNTLVAGASASSNAQGIVLNNGTSGTTIANNIVAGSGINAGVVIGQCPDAGPPALQSLENNLIFGTTQGLFKWANCYGGAGFGSVDALTADILATEPGATVQGNVTIASTCTTDGGTDSGCIVSAGCTSPQACLTTFFGGWDTPSNGYANLFPTTPFAGACPLQTLPPEGNGWTLGVTTIPPCRVTQSSLDDHTTTGLGVDLYGNCRSSTPTMGAEEESGATCQ